MEETWHCWRWSLLTFVVPSVFLFCVTLVYLCWRAISRTSTKDPFSHAASWLVVRYVCSLVWNIGMTEGQTTWYPALRTSGGQPKSTCLFGVGAQKTPPPNIFSWKSICRYGCARDLNFYKWEWFLLFYWRWGLWKCILLCLSLD